MSEVEVIHMSQAVSKLTNQALDYERYGFAVIPQLIPQATRDALLTSIHTLVSEYDFAGERSVFRTDDGDQGRDEVFFQSAYSVRGFLEAGALDEAGALRVPEDRALNKLGHALHDLIPAFTSLARSVEVREAFAIAGLAQAKLVQSMVIFKQPSIGGDVRWHQDASYLITNPSSVVGLWIALEDATLENGCLWMAPGAHQSPLRERYLVDWNRRSAELYPLDETPWPQEGEAIAVEVKAGDAVIFHDHMPHRSFANVSGRSRVAVTLHAHAPTSSWHPQNWLQRGALSDFLIGGE